MLHCPARRNDGVFPPFLWRSPPPKMKSAKIVPATTARSWLFPKISANPLFTLAEKRRFYRPKLPALRAEVDGLAQKSAKPFLLLRRSRLLPPPKAARRRSGFCAVALPDTPARRRDVRFCGFRRVRARLCPESRTNRRHGRDGVKRAAGHSCISCICSDSDIFGCGSVVIAYH